MIDIHNHILPAWDDGPTTLEETFTMARQAVSVGTTVMVASPHRSSAHILSTATRVRARVDLLNAELQAEDIPLQIIRGVEIPISATMVDEVESGEMSTLGSGNFLLAEPPFPNLPDYLLPDLAAVFERGYSAVLAHPERNNLIQRRWNEARSLDFVAACVQIGCVIQLTSGSILGRFGNSALEVSKAIVENRSWKIVIASDSHDSQERSPRYLAEARDTVAGWIGDRISARQMVEDLPAAIIGV